MEHPHFWPVFRLPFGCENLSSGPANHPERSHAIENNQSYTRIDGSRGNLPQSIHFLLGEVMVNVSADSPAYRQGSCQTGLKIGGYCRKIFRSESNVVITQLRLRTSTLVWLPWPCSLRILILAGWAPAGSASRGMSPTARGHALGRLCSQPHACSRELNRISWLGSSRSPMPANFTLAVLKATNFCLCHGVRYLYFALHVRVLYYRGRT